MTKHTNNPFGRYTKATDDVKQRIIWAGRGEPGVGKTTFGLTAPGPIVVQSFDKGLEGVVEPFAKVKDIYVAEYDWAPAPGAVLEQQEAIDLRDKFTEDFEHAILHSRTVLWDKESDVWNLFKYAEFGVSEKGKPQDWDSLKSRVRRLLNMPKALDINFGVIQSMKNEWVTKVNPKTGAQGITQSGARIAAGMDDVEALVHIVIDHSRSHGEFSLTVGKSRGPGSRDVQDQTFQSLDFPSFAQLVFPQSEPSDWE